MHSHLDRPPLGNMVETAKTLIVANPDLDFVYRHSVDGRDFTVATRELTGILDGVPLTSPDVLNWLHEYLSANMANLYGGVISEDN